MSWVTLDDAAPLHRKQVSVGMRACWVWTCGLAYCDRQEAKDGFIPDAVVKLLYPGITAEDVRRLVSAELWHSVEGGYQVHEYSEWRAKRFASARGAAGGQVKSDAKKAAATKREHDKRIAQRTTTSDHNETTTSKHNEPSTTNHNETTTRSDPIRSETDPISTTTDLRPEGPEPDALRETLCPVDLHERAEANGTLAKLAELLTVPIESIRHEAKDFAEYYSFGGGAGELRSGWMRQLRERIRKRHREGQLKPPGAIVHDAEKSAEDADLVRRAQRGEYGDRIRQMAVVRTPAAKLRVAIRERAERLVAKPPERERATITAAVNGEPVPVSAPPGRPGEYFVPIPESVVIGGPIPVAGDEEPDLPPLEERPRPPTPAAAAGQAGPVNLGGFAATLIAEKQRERDEKQRREQGS